MRTFTCQLHDKGRKLENLALCEQWDQSECNSDNEQRKKPHSLFPVSFGKIRIWAMMIPCAL